VRINKRGVLVLRTGSEKGGGGRSAVSWALPRGAQLAPSAVRNFGSATGCRCKPNFTAQSVLEHLCRR